MTTMVTRTQWGARPPSGPYNALSSSPKGHAIHWEGPQLDIGSHAECDDRVRSIQAYHMDSQGWSDIAYNLLACPHGYVYEGRGKGKGSAANGTSQANKDWYAICALCGEGDPQPAPLIEALKYAAQLCRDWGAGPGSTGHRDHYNTACPGDDLYERVQAGEFTTTAGTPTPPDPPSGSVPPTFPLPAGHYFGPKSGPDESHSGYYNNDDDRFRPWQQQMLDRGWSLDPYGADGLYGDVTANVCAQFQDEHGLDVDSLIGPDTWAAAWTEPVW